MKIVALAAVAAVLLMSPLPARAESNDELLEAVVETSLAPIRIVGATAGVGLGVPIASVRGAVEKTAEFQTKLAASMPEASSPVNTVYSTMMALPAGILVGTVEGVFTGCTNGLKEGFVHPFSAQSFSLEQ